MIEDPRGDIDYAEEGSGPTIVFVPGSWDTRAVWRGMIPLLRDRFRIVTTSLLGYGGTKERRTTTDTSIDREAEIAKPWFAMPAMPLTLLAIPSEVRSASPSLFAGSHLS